MLPTHKLARITLGLVTLVFSLSRKVILTIRSAIRLTIRASIRLTIRPAIRQTAQRSGWHNDHAAKSRLGLKVALAGLVCLLIGSGFYASTSAQGLGVPQFTQGFSQRFVGALNAQLNAWGFGSRANPNAANTAFACTLTQTVTVSGCYYAGGLSKATVSVEVGWTGAVNGDTITVSLDGGAQTKTINPQSLFNPGTGTNIAGPLVSPQVVAFEITADGGGHTMNVSMTGSATCSTSQESFNAPAACVPNLCTTGELGGTVFFDYDADGVKDTGEFNGAASVTVTAFDKNGATYTATSDGAGRYEFSAANGNTIATADFPVRLEFTNLPALGLNTTTPMGADNGSSVQFTSTAQCGLDVGVMDQNGFCQANPLVILPCYVNGDPAPNVNTSDAGDVDALIAFPYNIANGGPTPASMSHLATARQVGSLWGVSWNKFTKRLFTSAMLRRHVGLGPLGLGGLYVTNLTNPASPVTTNFIDITTLGVDLGQTSVPNVATRGLVANKLSPSYDTTVYGLVGKVGIGDMDIAEDGNKLWFVNLNDQQLYGLDITAYNTSNTLPTAGDVSSTAIPSPGCANGVHRPWGTKTYKGKVYVGSVCDASTGTRSDLKARISAYDPVANSWSTVFDFPLTYPKGYPFLSSAGVTAKTGWYAWTDNFTTAMTPTAAFGAGFLVIHPQPILSDIEFDLDGSMVLALGDRNGMQVGYYNYGPITGSTTLYLTSVGGDVLRANSSSNAFVLENNGKAGPVTGSGVGNFQGPGFGEFYNDNWSFGATLFHTEHSIGALAIRPGSGETISVVIDPVNSTANAGGVRFLNNTTGLTNKAYSVYAGSGNNADGLFGKASGLGDVELACAAVDYLEIGNRIWMDTDSDGVQDPGEMGVNGVQVQLWRDANADGTYETQVGQTTTATVSGQVGTYLFNSANVTMNGAMGIVPGTAGIDAASQYRIVIPNISGGSKQAALANKFLTTPGTGEGANPQLNDSNFSASNTSAIYDIPATDLATFGQDNHTFDAGFGPPVVDLAITKSDFSEVYCAGAPSVYVITVTNLGPNDVTGATITDALVAGITGGSWTCAGSGGATCAASGSAPINITANIPNNGVITIIYTANVSAAATAPITNVATVSVPSGTTDIDLTNNMAFDTNTAAAAGTVNGTAFSGGNQNGLLGAGETGIAGIKVTMTDNLGNMAMTVTGPAGTFSIGPLAGTSARVEFTLPTDGSLNHLKPSIAGPTTVQFVDLTQKVANQNVPFWDPSVYCQANPPLATPCYVNGDTNTTAPTEVLVRWPYSATGSGSNTYLANKNQVGSTWGIAYSRNRDTLYSGTFLKRHVGLGPNGLGAIYKTTNAAV